MRRALAELLMVVRRRVAMPSFRFDRGAFSNWNAPDSGEARCVDDRIRVERLEEEFLPTLRSSLNFLEELFSLEQPHCLFRTEQRWCLWIGEENWSDSTLNRLRHLFLIECHFLTMLVYLKISTLVSWLVV